MRKMSASAAEQTEDAEPARFIFSVALALWVTVMALSIPVSAFSQAIEGGGKRNYGTIPITLENVNNVGLLQTLTGHSDRAWTVAFSPDGRLLASCGQDGKVLVRDIDSLLVTKQMGSFPYWIVGLAFSPDGHYLAYGGANGFSSPVGPIGLWNVAADSLERVMNGHSGGCWSLDFQESSGILASGGFDGVVNMWDPQTGTLLKTLIGHTGAVLSVDFNPHQNLLASSATDYTVRLWDSQTGNRVCVLRGHTGNVGYVKFSPDGLTVASSADDGTVRLWNVADSSLIWSVNAGQGWVNCVNFNPDGSLMVTCGHDGSVVLRDAATGLQLKRLAGHIASVIRAAFNPAGTLVATAAWDNTVRLWGIEIDTDADGVPDDRDNCPTIPNPDQLDIDQDGVGGLCDNCPGIYNPGQEDGDGNGTGDVCDYKCGEANGDGIINVGDAVYVINYIFKSGPAPIPRDAGDANCDRAVYVGDAVYLINYIFKSGPAPCCPNTVPILITADIGEITQATAQCGGTVTSDNGGAVAARGVCWSTGLTPTVADDKTIDGIGIGSFASSITGLAGKTTYHVAAYATNSVGTGYGSIRSFTTVDSTGTVTDIDGNTYRTVKTGDQWWMAENLKVTHYRNGDPVPNVTDSSSWTSLTTGAYCNFNNDVANVATYGRLYNWYAASDGRDIAPAGWHVPSDAEWQTLVNYLGGDAAAGWRIKEVGTAHWLPPNAGGTNECGFTALPGGYRGSSYGIFADLGNYACFWTSSVSSSTNAWYRSLSYDYPEVSHYDSKKHYGFSIRCVRD